MTESTPSVRRRHRGRFALPSLLVLLLVSAGPALAWTDVFSLGTSLGTVPTMITHQKNYNGTQTSLVNTVCAAKGPNRKPLKKVLKRVVKTWNARKVTTGNLSLGAANNIPSNAFDIESVLLHEVGHCIHLGHVNQAGESGLSGNDTNYTKTSRGANGVYNLKKGKDKTIGSCDDKRKDDVNVNWFKIKDNDPFTKSATVTDKTTYGVLKSQLPKNNCVKPARKHKFSANGDRAVASDLGYADTEVVMQQGQYIDEAQRTLTADDVAGLAYSETGLDETAGTADDYSFSLKFKAAKKCDIPAKFDATSSPGTLAFCSLGIQSLLSPTHTFLTTATITIGTGINWFFNN